MKKGNRKNIHFERKTYNQLVKFFKDEEFLSLFNRNRATLEKFGGYRYVDAKTLTECRREIKTYLINKNIPYVWVQPILNMITGKYEFDFPIDNSISLFAGSQEITGSTEEILTIRNTRTGKLLGDDPTVSLTIGSKVSVEHLIKFIRKHKKEIEYWQDVMGVPEYKDTVFKNTDLALQILNMKDEKRMSYSEISKVLSDSESLSDEEINYLSSADNIKIIYHRFKKKFKI